MENFNEEHSRRGAEGKTFSKIVIKFDLKLSLNSQPKRDFRWHFK